MGSWMSKMRYSGLVVGVFGFTFFQKYQDLWKLVSCKCYNSHEYYPAWLLQLKLIILTAWFVKCVTASRWCDWKRIVTFKCLWHNYDEIVVWCCRIESFWCSTTQRYQKLSTKALSILVPFAHLSEQVLEPFEPLVWAALSSCVPRYVQIISEEHQRVAMFALMSSKVWKCVWCIMSSNFNNEDTAKPEVCDSRAFSKRGARTSLFSRRSTSFKKGWEPIN